MDFQYIDNDNALVAAMAKLNRQTHVAVDTEFVRTRTLRPILGLVQIYDGTSLLLIDPLPLSSLQPVWDLMADTSVVKVLHACGEDLDIFIKQGKVKPTPLFDTQVALSMLGQGISVGYSKMIQERLNVELDKSESRTDWTARPLTPKQLDYAARDVFYLWQVYQDIARALHERGADDWAAQEVDLLIQKRAKDIPAELCYLQIKDCWRLSPQQLEVLRNLAAWRDEVAKKRDKALNFVAKNRDLMTLAMKLPRSLNYMKRLDDMDRRLVERYGKELLRQIQFAEDTPAECYPLPVERINERPGYKALFDKLSKAIAKVAEANEVPKELLASKKQINELLGYRWQHQNAKLLLGAKPDILTGWRYTLLKDIVEQDLD